jgi:hypothetical protein
MLSTVEFPCMKRPAVLWILLFWLLLLAFGGLYGGIAMLIDPSGASLQMTEVIPLLPVHDYLLPGLFLLGVMGIFPLFLVYGLWFRPKGNRGRSFFSGGRYHPAWTGTVFLSIILALWLFIQGILIGFKWPIQYTTSVNGLLILIFAFLPSVRNFYRNEKLE